MDIIFSCAHCNNLICDICFMKVCEQMQSKCPYCRYPLIEELEEIPQEDVIVHVEDENMRFSESREDEI